LHVLRECGDVPCRDVGEICTHEIQRFGFGHGKKQVSRQKFHLQTETFGIFFRDVERRRAFFDGQHADVFGELLDRECNRTAARAHINDGFCLRPRF